ncbi:MAG TPA: hypothetical protein DGG95_01300 [Cytophagales bacterium]|jgi:hypothetical protein|nr:hypothetical protein [Cytophagales bacterium]
MFNLLNIFSSTRSRAKNKRTVLTILAGQSNCGVYNYLELPDKAESVFCWNVNTSKIDTVVSTEQMLGKHVGPLVFLANGMKKKFPKDDLYFLQWHKTNTTLAKDWDINDPKSLFADLTRHLDALLKQMPKPDKIIFIWMQGESDNCIPEFAAQYYEHEKELFGMLSTRYSISQIFNYQLSPWTARVRVHQAKELHSRNNKKITLLKVPKTGYREDHIHLSIEGAKAFADSVLNRLR